MRLFVGISFMVFNAHGQKTYKEETLFKYIEEESHDTLKVVGYVELAKKYRSKEPARAIFYMDKAEKLITKKLDSGSNDQDFYLNQLTKVYNVSGVIYRNFGNYPEAYSNYQKALDLLETVDNKVVYSSTLFNIGRLNDFMGKPREALEYFKKSLDVRLVTGEKLGLSNCYREIGKINYDLGNYDEALKNLEMSIEIGQSSGDTERVMKAYYRMGDVFLTIKRYDLARDTLSSGLVILNNSEQNLSGYHHSLSIRLANSLYNLGEIDEGLGVITKSIAETRRINDLKGLSKLYKMAAEGYRKKNDLSRANRWLLQRVEVDSLINANSNTAEIVRIEMNYLFQKQHVADSLALVNETKISELKLNEKNAAIESSRARIVFLLIATVLLATIGFFIYRNYRLKRNALKLKEKDVENLALKIKRESDWIDNLVSLNDRIKENKVKNTSEEIQKLVNSMRDNLVVDKHRQVQAKNIEVVTNEFREKLKLRFPDLTKTEIEMCELIRLELSNSEISRVRNISQNSARMARYRLKKKLNLEEGQTVFDALKEI